MEGIKINSGIFPLLDDQGDIGAWVDAYLLDRKAAGLSGGTINFYREKLKPFLDYCEMQNVHKIPDLTSVGIREFLLSLERSGHNPGGVHAHYRSLKTFLRWYEQELEPESWRNPISKVKAPKIPIETLEPVDLEVVAAMVGTCEKGTFCGERDRAIFLCLLDTGVRAKELLDMDLGDVEITGSILIRQGKGGKPRIVFLGKKSRRALRSYLRQRGDASPALWVTDEGERLQYPGLRSIIVRRAKLARVRAPSPHDFRRAFALNMLRAGVDLITLSRLMGHASLAMLQRYLKQLPDDLREAHQRASPVDNAF
jgi:site-specific recombinase XerD